MKNETNSKKIYRSRTIWVNILVLFASVALAVSDYIAASGTLSVVAIANIILRFLTKEGLKIR